MKRIDPAIPQPKLYLQTGRRDKTIQFNNLLPRKELTAEFEIFHEAPKSYLVGEITTDRDWLLVNGTNSFSFFHHTDQGPITVNLSINSFGLLMAVLRQMLFSFGGKISVPNVNARISLAQAFQNQHITANQDVPIAISIETLWYLFGFFMLVLLAFLPPFLMFLFTRSLFGTIESLVLAFFVLLIAPVWVSFARSTTMDFVEWLSKLQPPRLPR